MSTLSIAPAQALEERLQPLYAQLANHPLYRSFRTMQDLSFFMQAHVFAVWDFMSLLKALQRGLTCVDVPWIPSALQTSRRLVNEIVLGEESDMYQGQSLSHFELYRMAMQECGAQTQPIDRFLASLRKGHVLKEALSTCGAPAEAVRFVQTTFSFLAEEKLHVVAAAFTFGREDLIPEMFKGFVRDLNRSMGASLDTFLWYLERHIEVDGEEHGPMALRMIAELCGEDEKKWQEAEDAAVTAIQARIALWDGIAARLV